ncbi:MAG: S8 family serine peptidase [candidate division KSB1 bacterium]|nr:S8 family serine peptidase [candidate division KSB1 bacterium]
MKPGATPASLYNELSLRKSAVASAIVVGSEQPLFQGLSTEAMRFGLDRIYKLAVRGPYSEDYLARVLSELPSVEYAEPDYLYEVHFTPNDSLFVQQWYLRELRLPEAWDVEQGNASVIIGIVDTGVDINHPDLAAKIWTNTREIPNNGRDDDHNGYADDVHGWDFVNGVPDPRPKPNGVDDDGDGMADDGTDHGTAMAGLAGAATHNGRGIAGAGFRCTIMPVKSLSDEGSGSTSDLTNGIRYAIDNGAHVVNMSFGGGAASQTQRDVIEYGLSRNVVFVAAAGNSASDEEHYPSGYPGVLCVAATGFQGRLSSISNYGPTVDVAAPGGDFNVSPPAEIISTAPYFPEYGFSQLYRARTKEGYLTAGTSASAALVSGVAALVRSHFPSATWREVQQRIAGTCTNIDGLNPGYEGMIGDGLVNAYAAVATSTVPPVKPRIRLVNATVSDRDFGDGDGLLEHGETITVVATYRNYSVGSADNVRILLSTPEPGLEVLQSEYLLAHLEGETTATIPTTLSFRIRPDARGHIARIVLTHEEAGMSRSDTVKVLIGKTPVLVVDDDHDEVGGNTGDYDVEGYTIASLERLGINYSVWDIRTNGHPRGDFLCHFPIVIWLCEWAFPSLDAGDRAALRQFLERGGGLFLHGQDIGWDLCDPASDNTGIDAVSFYENYLHARYLSDDAESGEVRGIPGDPITDGLRFAIYQPGRNVENQYPDVMEPLNGARPIFLYPNGKAGGVRFSGAYRVVYMGFGFEAVDSKYSTKPSDSSTVRDQLMRRILEYLSPVEHEPLTDTEDVHASRPITVRISGDLTDLRGVRLFWRQAGEIGFHAVEMQEQAPGVYSGTIPAPHQPAAVEYYVEVSTQYFEWRKPAVAPRQVFRFYAGLDVYPPVITHVGLPNCINGEAPFEVVATVTDNLRVDTGSVYVHFRSPSVADSARLAPGDVPTQFRGQIPPVFRYGETVEYFLSAADASQARNRAISDTFRFVVGLEDFESGLTHWSAPQGGWGLETVYAHSGRFSVNDSPGGQYPNNANVSLETNFGFDFSQSRSVVLRFWTKYYLEFNHDYGYVEASVDGGQTWQRLGQPITGVQAQWVQREISLDHLTGSGMNDVRLRFRMQSDATQVPPFFGWFVDDVQVIEETGVAVDDRREPLPRLSTLYPNFPNPFNPSTILRYEVSEPVRVTLRVYDLLGHEVRTLVDSKHSPGSYQVEWDGRDQRGQPVASGVYLVVFEAGEVRAVQKALLLK